MTVLLTEIIHSGVIKVVKIINKIEIENVMVIMKFIFVTSARVASNEKKSCSQEN